MRAEGEATDRIVAMSPKSELRAFLGETVWVRRISTGWMTLPDGSRDLGHPVDWTIEFTTTPESIASGVGGGIGAGDEARTRDPRLGKAVLYH